MACQRALDLRIEAALKLISRVDKAGRSDCEDKLALALDQSGWSHSFEHGCWIVGKSLRPHELLPVIAEA
jgi:hypothetical protein